MDYQFCSVKHGVDEILNNTQKKLTKEFQPYTGDVDKAFNIVFV